MSATYEVHDGCTTLISDAGRAKYDEEQRLVRVDRIYTEIKIGSIGGALLTIAALILIKTFGG